MMLWTDLEGRELNGGWRLMRLVNPEGRAAWFEGTGPEGRAAMLSLTEALNDEDTLLGRMRAAAEIRHPNVVAVWESQLTWVDDIPVVVAAMEPTEENLGDVLRERLLSAEEARVLMDALLAGLAAIHRKSLVHGRMEAGSVLATGDTIKLRSDCLRIPGAAFAAQAAEDVRGLARVVVHAMTRRIPSGENDPVLQLLPEPMARAVRRALSGNATVEEVANLAGTRLAAVPDRKAPGPKPAAPRAEAIPAPVPAAAPKPAQPAEKPAEAAAKVEPEQRTETKEPSTLEKPGPQDAVVEKPESRVFPMKAAEASMGKRAAIPEVSRLLGEDDEPDWERRRSAPWVIGGAVALFVVTIFVLYGILHRGSGAKRGTAQPAATASHGAAAAPEKPSPMVARPAAGNGSAPAVSSAPGWHVVVYTYNRQAQAEQKAQMLARRYPGLQPGVFAPHGHAPWLVTLGGTMDRTQAINLRAKALRMGLPRDTYARNYR